MPVFTKRILAIFLLLNSIPSNAQNFEVYLSGGATFPRLYNDTVVKITNPIFSTYVTDRNTQLEPMGGIGIGGTFYKIFNSSFNLNLGINAYYANLGEVKGTEYPLVNVGSFGPLNYHFRLESYFFMFEPRLLYAYYPWQPYFLVGVGFTWNRFFNYGETPTSLVATPSPITTHFGDLTTRQIAYELGIGVEHEIYNDKCRKIQYNFAIDYRFIDLEKGQSEDIPGFLSSTYLKITQLSTYAVLMSLRINFY